MIVSMTGAMAGFGATIARCFVREGHRVTTAGCRQDRLDALRAELDNVMLSSVLDVLDANIAATLPGPPPGDWREVDVLVSNAGLALGLEPAQRINLTDWDRMIGTNCSGLVHMTRALLPTMVECSRGHITNIDSIVGTYPYPGGSVYGAAKALIHQFLLDLRADLTGTHVHISNVEPELCLSMEFSNVHSRGDDARVEKAYESMEAPAADDIVEAVYWMTALSTCFDVNAMELIPACQSFSVTSVTRGMA